MASLGCTVLDLIMSEISKLMAISSKLDDVAFSICSSRADVPEYSQPAMLYGVSQRLECSCPFARMCMNLSVDTNKVSVSEVWQTTLRLKTRVCFTVISIVNVQCCDGALRRVVWLRNKADDIPPGHYSNQAEPEAWGDQVAVTLVA